MNDKLWDVFRLIASGISGGILAFWGVIVASDRSAKATKETANAGVQVAMITERESIAQRLALRMDALELTVDKERGLRRGLEDEDHRNKQRITELEDEVRKMRAEKVLAFHDYQDHITAQDEIIHRLQGKVAELEAMCARLSTELEVERARRPAETEEAEA